MTRLRRTLTRYWNRYRIPVVATAIGLGVILYFVKDVRI